MSRTALITMVIASEADVVACRQRARDIGRGLALAPTDQVRVATAVSEIARNALVYAREGRCEVSVEPGPPARVWFDISDRGPGIPTSTTSAQDAIARRAGWASACSARATWWTPSRSPPSPAGGPGSAWERISRPRSGP